MTSARLSLLVLAVLAAAAVLLICWPMPEESAKRDPHAWHVVGFQGLEEGGFNQPRGIAALPDGSFVVADRSARIQHFDADGKPLKLWIMQEHRLGNPKGLAALPNGNLLVCDTHYGRVVEMTLDGRTVKVWGGPGKEPGQFVHPLSCTVDAKAGVAYIVEYGAWNDRVHKWSLDGKFIKAWGSYGAEPGQLNRPSGIALGPEGNIYVADACNHRIQKFDSEGKLLKVWGELGDEPGQLRYPYDIACAPDGKLYVAEYNNQRVSVFDREGTLVRTIGGPGRERGQFGWPWSLTVDRQGRLLVSDTANHRIQIIQVSEPAPEKLARAE